MARHQVTTQECEATAMGRWAFQASRLRRRIQVQEIDLIVLGKLRQLLWDRLQLRLVLDHPVQSIIDPDEFHAPERRNLASLVRSGRGPQANQNALDVPGREATSRVQGIAPDAADSIDCHQDAARRPQW
jgi:hypothetical protein